MVDETLAPLAELLPAPTELNAPHLEGLAAGELRLQHCRQCGQYQYPPESFCYHCPSTDLEWETVDGSGTVYSYIVVHQRYHPAFGDRLPYNVAVVQLDEGPRMLSNVLGIEPDAVEIGMRVRPRIETLGEEGAALFFEPADG
ncbi:MAG: Zn-ribbon domain-containing OB-fold protein [Dehalococcoidia bacterium]